MGYPQRHSGPLLARSPIVSPPRTTTGQFLPHSHIRCAANRYPVYPYSHGLLPTPAQHNIMSPSTGSFATGPLQPHGRPPQRPPINNVMSPSTGPFAAGLLRPPINAISYRSPRPVVNVMVDSTALDPSKRMGNQQGGNREMPGHGVYHYEPI